MEYTIGTQKMRYVFSSLGGELISAVDEKGCERIHQGTPGYWERHAPVLFPVCGRLHGEKYRYHGKEYGMKIHGFLPDTELSAEKVSDGELIFRLSDTEETRKVYPFGFSIELRYKAEGETLALTATVTNTGDGELPFMLGWHPGFLVGFDGRALSDYRVSFGKASAVLHPLNGAFVNGEKIDYRFDGGCWNYSSEELYPRDTLIFSETAGKVRLFAEGSKKAITVQYSENLPYLCIWKSDTDDAKFLCLEPWSGVPADDPKIEDFETRNYMARLQPGSKETYTFAATFDS